MSKINIFENRKIVDGKTQVPVWFMRQAGRYHNHYQNLKKDYDFMTLCKTPDLACETTMGPIRDFKFDAAILFSDILFPLEQMNMGLTYNPGPILQKKLESPSDLKDLKLLDNPRNFYNFQKEACAALTKTLPADTTLLGFVGAPFTLYTYAVEGAHAGSLVQAKKGLYNGLFQAFAETLLPNLLENMFVQAEGGAEAMCLFDTAVGELTLKDFKTYMLPLIKTITSEFKKVHPDKKIIYYSKNTHADYLREIQDDNIDVLGVDWRHDIGDVLNEFGKDYYIQGNFDPCWLHLSWEECQKNLEIFYRNICDKNAPQDKWICGLGHGVLVKTPEENVKNAVQYIHDNFKY